MSPEFNNMIKAKVENHHNFVAQLKKDSPYWPQVLYREKESEFQGKGTTEQYISTLVRIKRNDVWYSIHCVESALMETAGIHYWKFLAMKMNSSVYGIQLFYQVNIEMPDGPIPDEKQIEETERLRIMYMI
jgi:hypothetical protein